MVVVARTLRWIGALLVPMCVVFVGPRIVEAGLGAGATPTFPAVVTVGDTGVVATIQMKNDNTAPNTTATLCNFGDPSPCPANDPGITLIPSCGRLGTFSSCVVPDPDVFAVSATGTGQPGTACAGTTFAITLIDPAFGQLRFTPQPPGSHVVLPTVGSVCQVDFTFDVLKAPTVDQNAGAPGLQTVQVVDFTESDGTITASARGTSIGTRVERATPAIETLASPSVVVGGQLSDQATVSGRVNPQQGATVDFRLYGPNDTTCSGAPAFESLSIPYPVAGGPVTSGTYTVMNAGTYEWVATYSGDANNNPVTGACNAVNEGAVVTPATPTIATVASPSVLVGGQLTDQATVSGRVNPQPGATIDFRLYGPNDTTCTGPPVFQAMGIAYPVAEGPVSSPAFTAPLAGTYVWVATYSGDANNTSVIGACTDAGEAVTVTPRVAGLGPRPPGTTGVLPATGVERDEMLRLACAASLVGLALVAMASTPRRRRVRTARR